MAVTIRLSRKGTTKRPYYRLVATDSKASRDGKFLEILGTYDPKENPALVKLHKEKVNHWLAKGASVSESARAILRKEGFLKGS